MLKLLMLRCPVIGFAGIIFLVRGRCLLVSSLSQNPDQEDLIQIVLRPSQRDLPKLKIAAHDPTTYSWSIRMHYGLRLE